jgi:hypothetical protein
MGVGGDDRVGVRFADAGPDRDPTVRAPQAPDAASAGATVRMRGPRGARMSQRKWVKKTFGLVLDAAGEVVSGRPELRFR